MRSRSESVLDTVGCNLEAAVAFLKLRVDWFDRWHSDLDAALSALPELETCPNELYRELATRPIASRKRIALVTRHDQPIAVIGLRWEEPVWTPVTTWIVPGALFPVRPGMVLPALAALRCRVSTAWWRQAEPPPDSALLNVFALTPTRILTCGEGFEEYWRESGLATDLKRAKKKCASFRLELNHPGAAEWVIRMAAQRWAASGSEELRSTDKLSAARYWAPRGRLFSHSLLDGDRIVAADVSFAHRRVLVGLVNYRDPEYHRYSVGTRLLEIVHRWAADSGFEQQDFGGGFAYKERWAPAVGSHCQFVLRPSPLDLPRVAEAMGRRLRIVIAKIGSQH